MAKNIENKLRQAVPILLKVPETGALSLYILKDREVKQIDDDQVSQDITDKSLSNCISVDEVVIEEEQPGI